MWNRKALKENGKANLKKNYWNSVLVAFIYSLFIGASSASFSNSGTKLSQGENGFNFEDPETVAIIMAVLAAASAALFILSILKILLKIFSKHYQNIFTLLKHTFFFKEVHCFGYVSHNFPHNKKN